MRIPKVKVCGVTRMVDLDLLAGEGVDTVGFNFVASSPRAIDPVRAGDLCARAGELNLLRVAVVMNLSELAMRDLLGQIDVDLVQLHGGELPGVARYCAGLPIIRATSWSGRSQESELVAAWNIAADESKSSGEAETKSELAAWLVDAYAPAQGGGTGRVARWDLLFPRPRPLSSRPLILAGGLTPKNVTAAITATVPHGVDTASGVETSPGVKDIQLVREFASNARRALAAADE
jgi:phosphoribosylanthranilate isomerase